MRDERTDWGSKKRVCERGEYIEREENRARTQIHREGDRDKERKR
jgi:hypothetical protein